MSTRVSVSLLLLLALVLAFNVGDFAAQDPMPATTPATQATQTATQTDLSGTYAGTFNCEAAGLMGDTTLTITGNQFTTADGKSGRIVATNSGGYTAVALQLGDTTPAATSTTTTAAATTPPQIISLRARKKGDRLTLMSVPGSTMKCSFAPTSATARGRRTPRTPAATGTQVAMPEAMPEQTPAPSPSPTATPSPEPQPSPEPNPSPGPSPMPTPMPTPVPNPSPSPSPSPTASPTPSPTPALSHR